jgi:hypothetical protein
MALCFPRPLLQRELEEQAPAALVVTAAAAEPEDVETVADVAVTAVGPLLLLHLRRSFHRPLISA